MVIANMAEATALAGEIAARLKERGETVAVAESSAGGLIAAALLAVPGASAYFLGGSVVYTGRAMRELLGLSRETLATHRSASPERAQVLAGAARDRLGATWGLGETGAAGPTGNPYGDAPGHTCIAVAGPMALVETIETASPDRAANMVAFTVATLRLFRAALER